MNALTDSLTGPITIIFMILLAIGLFFLVLTRLSLVLQANTVNANPATAHIYWIYKIPFFIWLTDRMFIVSSILLGQYGKLVNCVVRRLNPSLKGKRILQISCAFGNVSEKIAESCARQGAAEFVLTDIMQSELNNARRKLKRFGKLCTYSKQDATDLAFEDQSFDYVVAFFLPHELPLDKKIKHIEEAKRVLKPGGKVVFGEFHKPRLKILEILGRIYFKIFEPYATEMWDGFDLAGVIDNNAEHSYKIEKDTFLFDNFQVLAAERLS